MHMRARTYVVDTCDGWRTTYGSQFSFHLEDLRDQTQAVSLGSKHIYSQSSS